MNAVEARVDDWVVVIRPDGIVEAVAGGAPIQWTGRAADEAFAGYAELCDALPTLIEGPMNGSSLHRVRVRSRHADRPIDVELLVLEAVPIRRAQTRLDDLVLETLEVFAAQATIADVALDIALARDLPSVAVIDKEKIAWALATLVGNALRHLQRSEAHPEGRKIVAQAKWDGARDDVVLTVRDNGPGIARARAKWLFERDPATGRAAGLGLVMVRDIVVAHRGSVEVVSDLGKGTEITMRFPRRV